MRRVLFAALAIGCGGPSHASSDASSNTGSDATASQLDAPTDGPSSYSVARSGTRLKLSWWQTADGVRSPSDDGFYDSELGTICRPTAWADASPIISGGPYTTPTYFNTYTQPASLCGGLLLQKIIVPGADVTPAVAYAKQGNLCVLADPHDHFNAAVEIPESTFVEVTTNYDATGAISQMHWDSTDGAGWYRPSGYDTVLAATCDYQTEYDTFSATAAICDPRGSSTTGFSDSMCTLPLTSTAIGCTPPAYVRPLNLCGYQYDHRAFAVGSAISPNPVYDASCSPGNPDIHSDYYAVSSTPAGSVQTLSRAPDTSGTTRLKPIFLDTADGVHYQTNIFYDSTLDTQCAFGSTNMCGPILTKNTMVLYTDSGCTTPFDAIEVDDDPSSCGTSLAPVPDYAIKILGAGQFEYHRVGAQHGNRVREHRHVSSVSRDRDSSVLAYLRGRPDSYGRERIRRRDGRRRSIDVKVTLADLRVSTSG